MNFGFCPKLRIAAKLEDLINCRGPWGINKSFINKMDEKKRTDIREIRNFNCQAYISQTKYKKI